MRALYRALSVGGFAFAGSAFLLTGIVRLVEGQPFAGMYLAGSAAAWGVVWAIADRE